MSNSMTPEEYFRQNVEEKYLCKGCKSLLLKPRQLDCGCSRFCDKCEVSSTCIDCGKKVTLISDKAFVKDLKRIELKCVFDNCSTKVIYDRYLDHVTICDFRLIECKDCNKMVTVKELNDHRINSCIKREMKCLFCSKMARLSQHLRNDELAPPDCDKFIGQCPNCKAKKVVLKKHFKICTTKPCLLREIGCPGFVKNAECSSILDHKDIIDAVLGSLTFQLERISETIDIDKIDEKMLKEVKELHKDTLYIKEQLKLNLDLYNVPRTGKFLWRINNASQVLRDKDSITSKSMYSEEYGYKLCIKIYPQGDGRGKPAFFSLYYAVMKGEYDALLQWPFSQKVRLSIYNQLNKSKTKRETYRPDFKSDSSLRPKYDINTATGNPKFIRRDELMNNGYIKDDVMFIEISIGKEKTFF